MDNLNRQVILAERPRYIVPTANVFQIVERARPGLGKGKVLVRTTFVGLDSYLYGRLKRISQFVEPLSIGDVMVGATIGRIEESDNPALPPGTVVHGSWGWQDYYLSDGRDLNPVDSDLPSSTYVLGALGVSGFGAYIAVSEIARVQQGETLTCGAALGGLGQMVGQIAKLKGAKVIAGASGPEKCRIATERLGFDICLDRTAKDFLNRVRQEYAKAGIDCYVMAAGGAVLETALPYFNRNARIAVCGLMATYTADPPPPGPDRTTLLFNEIIHRRLRVTGLVTEDHLGTALHARFKQEMKQWILSGVIQPLEHFVNGLEHAAETLQGLFEGKSLGKAIVRVAD